MLSRRGVLQSAQTLEVYAMAVWVVRQSAPKWGAWDKIALENGVVVIDFGLETDISNFRDRRAMEDYLRQNAHALYGYRSGPPGRVRHAVGQVWRFYKCIAPGDIAVYHVWEDERRVRVGEFLEGGAYQKEFRDYCEGWRSEKTRSHHVSGSFSAVVSKGHSHVRFCHGFEIGCTWHRLQTVIR